MSSFAEGDIAYLNGNKFSPVLFIHDDPSNESEGTDNVIVVPLGSSVSVPRDTVSDEDTGGTSTSSTKTTSSTTKSST